MLRLALGVAAVGLVVGALMPGGRDAPAAADTTLAVDAPPKMFANPQANAAVSGPWSTLQRRADGHFYARALVNGQGVEFMIDTGASGVALTENDARRIGITLDPAQYQVVGTGASGPVSGQFVTLDSVSLDGKRVDGVAGAVLDGLPVSLLGQSFLARMGRIEISGDTMVIR